MSWKMAVLKLKSTCARHQEQWQEMGSRGAWCAGLPLSASPAEYANGRRAHVRPQLAQSCGCHTRAYSRFCCVAAHGAAVDVEPHLRHHTCARCSSHNNVHASSPKSSRTFRSFVRNAAHFSKRCPGKQPSKDLALRSAALNAMFLAPFCTASPTPQDEAQKPR